LTIGKVLKEGGYFRILFVQNYYLIWNQKCGIIESYVKNGARQQKTRRPLYHNSNLMSIGKSNKEKRPKQIFFYP